MFLKAFFVATILFFSFAPDYSYSQEKKGVKASRTEVIEITANKHREEEDVGKIEAAGDPIEPVNRGTFAFNEALDDAVLTPISRGYKKVVPEVAREKVGNFFSNLTSPVTFVNSALQGDVNNTFTVFWRFFVNTTFGVGGLYDVASEVGLKEKNEDFGQTLGAYGAKDSSYIVLPILGPSTTRDVFGLVVDALTNPFNYLSGGTSAALTVGKGIQTRTDALELTDEIDNTSFDPYSTYRSAYIQKRNDMINNGESR